MYLCRLLSLGRRRCENKYWSMRAIYDVIFITDFRNAKFHAITNYWGGEYFILSAIVVSFGLSWNIGGSLYIPKDAASNLCTMTSAIKRWLKTQNKKILPPSRHTRQSQTCVSSNRGGEMGIQRRCKPIMMIFWGTEVSTIEVNCLHLYKNNFQKCPYKQLN